MGCHPLPLEADLNLFDIRNKCLYLLVTSKEDLDLKVVTKRE